MNAFKGFFSLKGRIGRREFILLSIGIIVFQIAIERLLSVPKDSFCQVAFTSIFFLITLPVTVRRFHDCQVTVKIILLMAVIDAIYILSKLLAIHANYAIPYIVQLCLGIVGIILLLVYLSIIFKRGTEGDNPYGPKPEEFSLGVKFTYGVWIVAIAASVGALLVKNIN